MSQIIVQFNGIHSLIEKCNELIKLGYWIDFITQDNNCYGVIIAHKIGTGIKS